MTGPSLSRRSSLPGDSSEWRAFGLVPPDGVHTPAVPQGLVLTSKPQEPGVVHLDWKKARRATRDRVWRQRAAESEPVAVATVGDNKALCPEQPTGEPLRFSISAANDTGESRPSAAGEIVL